MKTNAQKPVDQLLTERGILARQLEELDRQILERFGAFKAALDSLLSASGVPSHPAPMTIIKPAPTTQAEPELFEVATDVVTMPNVFISHKRPGVGARIEEFTLGLLKREKRPMKTKEIYDSIVEEGTISIPGQDPRSNVGAHLALSKKIRNTGNGWWFVGEEP